MQAHVRPSPASANPASFEATGRLLSMTLAAGELHVTHGAVSRQIKTLEVHLGVALFRAPDPQNRPDR